MLTRQPTCKTLQLKAIKLHPNINAEARKILATTMHFMRGEIIFSPEGLLQFLNFHPPHVVKHKSGIFHCFAGIRAFQLASTHLPAKEKITVLVHPKLKSADIENLAIEDAYLTSLAFSLDDRNKKLEIIRIWQQVEKAAKRLFTPQLLNKLAMAKLLKCNRRDLSPKNKFAESSLKEMATKQAS